MAERVLAWLSPRVWGRAYLTLRVAARERERKQCEFGCEELKRPLGVERLVEAARAWEAAWDRLLAFYPARTNQLSEWEDCRPKLQCNFPWNRKARPWDCILGCDGFRLSTRRSRVKLKDLKIRGITASFMSGYHSDCGMAKDC